MLERSVPVELTPNLKLNDVKSWKKSIPKCCNSMHKNREMGGLWLESNKTAESIKKDESGAVSRDWVILSLRGHG